MGVSSFANKLTIEKRAFRKGYDQTDSIGLKHPTKEVCCKGDDCIVTGVDVDEICKMLNNSAEIMTCASTDAGRFD